MIKTRHAFILFLALAGSPSFAQTERPAFMDLMAMAKVKKLLQVDTPAGNTNVMLVSVAEDPQFVFVFASGGPGALFLTAGPDGAPTTKRLRNPTHDFAPHFLKLQAAWAAIDVPESYGHELMPRELRLEQRHIDAVAQVGRRIREEYPKARLILIGHSNGGITAGLQAVQPKPAFDAVVLSAPQLVVLPYSWKPEQSRVPLLFITHKHDDCFGSKAYQTEAAAGRKFPVVVIEAPSLGSRSECHAAPGPHFYTNAHAEFASAVYKWTAALK